MKFRQCSRQCQAEGSPRRTQWARVLLQSSHAPHHRPRWTRTLRRKGRPLRVPQLLHTYGRQARVAAVDQATTVARLCRQARRGRRDPPRHPSRGLRARVRQRWSPSPPGRRHQLMPAARRRSCWSSWRRYRAHSRRHGLRREASSNWTRPASTRTTRTTTTSRRQIWTRRRRMSTWRAAVARGPTAVARGPRATIPPRSADRGGRAPRAPRPGPRGHRRPRATALRARGARGRAAVGRGGGGGRGAPLPSLWTPCRALRSRSRT